MHRQRQSRRVPAEELGGLNRGGLTHPHDPEQRAALGPVVSITAVAVRAPGC
jgi:hypothetical protein